MAVCRLLAVCGLSVLLIGSCAYGKDNLVAWQEDSMTKVFQYPLAGANTPATAPATSAPAPRPPIQLHAARNEVVSAQFVLQASGDLTDLKCEVQPLTGPGTAKIASVRVRYVGYVPVKRNSDDSAIRRAPADFPDPLLENPPPVKAQSLQPIWVTIAVPKDAPPGDYTGQITFSAAGTRTQLPIQLTVHRYVLGDQRTLMIANWMLRFPLDNVQDEGYWALLAVYAKNMAAHRQNTILTGVKQLAKVSVGPGSKLIFDFSRLDRWIQVFTDAGVLKAPREGLIEGEHLASGAKYGESNHTAAIWIVKDGKAVKQTVSAWSEENHQFLRAFLPALQAHLDHKGLLAIYRQHIFDEPVPANADHYRELAKILHEVAPKLKTIEATHSSDLIGDINTWVPQTDHLSQKLSFYRDRQKAGDEVWFYICLSPHSPHLNRFIDYSLLKPRLIHWMNFKYGITGYLHWGWNCWPTDPFTNVINENGGQDLPPGDTHMVYPKPGGLLDSIRTEAQLEGIQDYELLKALSAKNPDKAKAICEAIIQDWTKYTLDVAVFRAARKQLLEALSQ